MVEASAANGSDQPLGVRVLPRVSDYPPWVSAGGTVPSAGWPADEGVGAGRKRNGRRRCGHGRRSSSSRCGRRCVGVRHLRREISHLTESHQRDERPRHRPDLPSRMLFDTNNTSRSNVQNSICAFASESSGSRSGGNVWMRSPHAHERPGIGVPVAAAAVAFFASWNYASPPVASDAPINTRSDSGMSGIVRRINP